MTHAEARDAFAAMHRAVDKLREATRAYVRAEAESSLVGLMDMQGMEER